jgi:hypothetical protein
VKSRMFSDEVMTIQVDRNAERIMHCLAVYTLLLKQFSIILVIEPNFVGEKTLSNQREEIMKMEIKIMEKEILYLKGRKRERAKKAYYKLLQECGGICGLNEPIYLRRAE